MNIDFNNLLSHIGQYIPFVGMVAGKTSSNPLSTRLIEAVIIAGIAGYISSQITLAGLQTDMDWIKSYTKETRTELNNFKEAYYNRLDK